METSPWCYSAAGHHIATIFCTWHDSRAVVPRTKFCSDHRIRIEMRVKQNSPRIWIAMEKPLVKRGPVSYSVSSCNMNWCIAFLANRPLHCGKFESTIAYFPSILADCSNNASCLTPIGIRHEVLARAHEGMRQSNIAGRVGLTRATVNRILWRHVASGTLVPGKSMGAPRQTTPRQDRALIKMVWKC